MYELVKVIYLLNPEPNESLSECAPEIRDYIEYLKWGDPDYEEEAVSTQELLPEKTLHTEVFKKCTFARVERPAWDTDVKFMLPVLILTWLR
jgi:hypothetical protein